MKNKILVALTFFVFAACEKEELNTLGDSGTENTNDVKVEYDLTSELKKDFAIALAAAVKESKPLRSLIKEEALKMFDNDYDILYHMIKHTQLSDGKTFRDVLLDHYENKDRLSQIESSSPKLTIFVPQLPEDSFSATSWDIENEIPKVAIRMYTTNHVPIFDSEGEEFVLKGGIVPGFPVLVIKENERVIVEDQDVDGKMGIAKGAKFSTKENDLRFRFLSDAFDQSKQKTSPSTFVKDSNKMFQNIDQKIIDAYEIYENVDGWHRDYIYYNITPNNTRDQFYYDFQEHISSFRLKGTPLNVIDRISDQTGDPEINGVKDSPSASSWTGGGFVFKVRALVNGKNGIGSEIIDYFDASPNDLFNLHYYKHDISIGSLKISVWLLDTNRISFKTKRLNFPIFNWDLNQYASSIKIEIEEVDLTETTVLTDKRFVEFATNFEISSGAGQLLKKVGLKFGASYKISDTQTIQKTFTEGNDELGSVLVNFADDVITGYPRVPFLGRLYTFRNYSAGFFTITVEPKRVQP